MSSCDLCGRDENLFIVRIEGSIINACRNCSRFGKIIGAVEEFKNEKRIGRENVEYEDSEFLVDRYNEIIRKEREKRNLKQDELANKLNEKESVIQKIESGQIVPNLKLARKIERFLGVKLLENIPDVKIKLKHSEMKGFTLGDVIK